jgi:hypothetical protein
MFSFNGLNQIYCPWTCKTLPSDTLWTEVKAAFFAIQQAKEAGLQDFILESDASTSLIHCLIVDIATAIPSSHTNLEAHFLGAWALSCNRV